MRHKNHRYPVKNTGSRMLSGSRAGKNFMTGTLMFPKFCALSISTWEPVTLS